MDVWVVAWLAPAQVAVQRDPVKQRLQRVVRLDHRGLECLGAVVPRGQRLVVTAKTVGLEVDDEVTHRAAVTHPQHGVDAAGEVAAQRGRLQLDQRVGVPDE